MTRCGLTPRNDLWPATQAQSVTKAEYKRNTSEARAEYKRPSRPLPACRWLVDRLGGLCPGALHSGFCLLHSPRGGFVGALWEPCGSLVGALGTHWGGLRVALGTHWGGYRLAINTHWGGFDVALRWLCVAYWEPARMRDFHASDLCAFSISPSAFGWGWLAAELHKHSQY
jgi:hypothetical protein